jgi:hypothetical protein
MTGQDPTVGRGNEEAFVPVFSSSNHDAEMEALTIKGILESNNIPTMLVGPHMLPNLDFQVHVPEHQLEQATQLIEEARKAGPAAAEEAERESEGQ